MKKFTIINDEVYAVKEAGYKLDFESEIHTNFPKGFSENRKNREIDSFYDLDCAMLCKDENGELFAVEYYYGMNEKMPMIWQKVTEV